MGLRLGDLKELGRMSEKAKNVAVSPKTSREDYLKVLEETDWREWLRALATDCKDIADDRASFPLKTGKDYETVAKAIESVMKDLANIVDVVTLHIIFEKFEE